MKVFDSNKNQKWAGKGFELKSGSFLILKSANFSHPIQVTNGTYRLKILGKRRTGSGKVEVEVLTDENEVLLKRELNFTSNAWAEHNFEFNSKQIGAGKIRFIRPKDIYGSIEISRIYLDQVVDLNPETFPSKIRKSKLKSGSKKIKGFDLLYSDGIKKIAMIVPYHIYGGAEVYLQNIINNLDGKYQVTILYLQENALQNMISNKNILHRSVKGLDQLRGILKTSEYDFVIYYNRSDVYYLLSQMKSNFELAGSLIEIYHSDFVWSGSLSMIKSRENVDKIISVSKSLALDISGNFKREVIPIGIDLKRFNIRENIGLKSYFNVDNYRGTIGTIARLSKEKRVDYLLDLASVMSEYQFIIIGEGPEEKKLRGMIKNNNLTNVELVGFKKDVEDYYNILDAFVLSSRIEGTPISIIEAMALGVPVFTNMVGAISDLIIDQETGFKLTENPQEDAQIIINGIGNQKVINAARGYVEEHHDVLKNSYAFVKSLFLSDNFFVERGDNNVPLLPGQYI